MTKQEFEDFVDKVSVKGSVLGLESMNALLDRMGHPEQSLKYIHIAGTNGKGSVLAFTSTILKCQGLKVGRYISPVIEKYNEKIQINEKSISQKDLYEGMEFIKQIYEKMAQDKLNLPTIFEIETALAFWYFARNNCDIVVLETGMGGREDATNVIPSPEVAVLTSISMDHMAILGDSIEKIASVKAGIIKPGCQVVSALQEEEAKAVIEKEANANNTTVRYAKEPTNVRYGLDKQMFSYGNQKNLEIELCGTYQPINACIALEVIDALRERGYIISDKAVRQGLLRTKWVGRFTILCKKPLFIMDGAHNADAAKQLRTSILTYLKGKPLIFIMGVFADKEYEKVIAETADLASFIIAVATPDNSRALPAIDLAKAVSKVNPNVTNADSIEEAAEMAFLLSGNLAPLGRATIGKCAIVAFGSLSYLGRLKAFIDKGVDKITV